MFNQLIYQNLLTTKCMGHDLVYLDETGSTNSVIGLALNEAGIEKRVVVAKKQTVGRGRFGRVWRHTPGLGLAFSLAWPIPDRFEEKGVITLTAGVALAKAVAEVTDIAFDLKYPNDLLLHGKKAGGILAELKSADGKAFAIIGVGMNVNHLSEDIHDEIKRIATSLRIESGEKVVVEAILALFLNHLEIGLDSLHKDGPARVIEGFKRYSNTIGKKIGVNSEGCDVSGVAIDILETGELVVKLDDGGLGYISSGEMKYID